jgi:ubiquinone/menaquinone biosynthesis C-methylase UbiE
MKRENAFRDTNNWYTNRCGYASPNLVNFAMGHAGNRVLDIGCATGEYIQKLKDYGFECVGVDANPKYVKEANTKGNEVYNMDAKHLELPDKSFDTALLFEVLEHIDDPAEVLKEAKRVSRKNVLITVPNCAGFDKLGPMGLTFVHMLEKDHVNFFTKKDLEELLSKHFNRSQVVEAEPILVIIDPTHISRRWWLSRSISALVSLGLIPSKLSCGLNAYYRLYGIADVV